MAEYTVEDYRKAAKAAYEAGDIEAAEALIEEGMALEQRLKPAPTGAEIVEQFDDGGRILKSTQTGQETYVTDGYTTSDPARIAQIRAAGGKAGEVYKTSMAEDIISQVGELPARAASAIKGVPFVGSYIDEIIGQFSPEAAQATRAAQEAREIVAPVAVITPDEDTVKLPEPMFMLPAVIEPIFADIASKVDTFNLPASIVLAPILSALKVPEVILSASKLVTVI